jgi:thiol peroxidase
MAIIELDGNPAETCGTLPEVSSMAPDFILSNTAFSDVSLASFKGKRIILNIFPSIDLPVCAATVRRFNEAAGKLPHTVVLCISADLPFAHSRFCEGEGLKNVIPLSVFRSDAFGKDYGVLMTAGSLTGLLSRAIVIIDEGGKVIYTEQVPDIGQEPDYDAALKASSM